mmetsp:Transcript_5903/g.21070  ORF Transcript_5903/g.21070 Transcript_5903/m.21070 type:complete len:224 (+) Transcript_5903:116-787(+)
MSVPMPGAKMVPTAEPAASASTDADDRHSMSSVVSIRRGTSRSGVRRISAGVAASSPRTDGSSAPFFHSGRAARYSATKAFTPTSMEKMAACSRKHATSDVLEILTAAHSRPSRSALRTALARTLFTNLYAADGLSARRIAFSYTLRTASLPMSFAMPSPSFFATSFAVAASCPFSLRHSFVENGRSVARYASPRRMDVLIALKRKPAGVRCPNTARSATASP